MPPSSAPTVTAPRNRWFFRLASIRTKMLMFAVLATLLPSLTTVWISYIENTRALAARASEEILGVSAQAQREVALWTKELQLNLLVFASSYEVTDNLAALPQKNGEPQHTGIYYRRLTDYLNSVRDRFADYAELLVLDRHGHVVAASNAQSRPLPLPADWARSMTRNNWAVGEPYWDSTSSQAEMLVSIPIASGRGASRGGRDGFIGAIAARVGLRTIADTLRRFAPGKTGQIYLMMRSGRLVVSSKGSSRPLLAQSYTRAATNWLLAREGRALQFASFTGERVLGSVHVVPSLDWVLVSEIPSAEAFQQVARLRNVTLAIVTALLAVVGALAYLLSMLIVRPLNRLTLAASKVAEGDLDVGLPVTTSSEVGYLTRVFNDMVVRLRESRAELERLSVTDPLTGLSNRLRLMEVLENEARRARRLRHPFAVVMADLDLFKKYNDEHGHPAGDAALKRVATIMREASRDVDFVARYGGEEFLIMMPETELDGAVEFAERIRAKVAGEKLAAGRVQVSMGVAAFPKHGDAPDALIGAADAALYEAKRAGGNRVVAATRPKVPA